MKIQKILAALAAVALTSGAAWGAAAAAGDVDADAAAEVADGFRGYVGILNYSLGQVEKVKAIDDIRKHCTYLDGEAKTQNDEKISPNLKTIGGGSARGQESILNLYSEIKQLQGKFIQVATERAIGQNIKPAFRVDSALRRSLKVCKDRTSKKMPGGSWIAGGELKQPLLSYYRLEKVVGFIDDYCDKIDDFYRAFGKRLSDPTIFPNADEKKEFEKLVDEAATQFDQVVREVNGLLDSLDAGADKATNDSVSELRGEVETNQTAKFIEKIGKYVAELERRRPGTPPSKFSFE